MVKTMELIIKENKLVIITKPKTIRFDFLDKFDLKHEIDLIIKYNECLAGHKINTKISL